MPPKKRARSRHDIPTPFTLPPATGEIPSPEDLASSGEIDYKPVELPTKPATDEIDVVDLAMQSAAPRDLGTSIAMRLAQGGTIKAPTAPQATPRRGSIASRLLDTTAAPQAASTPPVGSIASRLLTVEPPAGPKWQDPRGYLLTGEGPIKDEPLPTPVDVGGEPVNLQKEVEPGLPDVTDVEPRGAQAGIFEPYAQIAQSLEDNGLRLEDLTPAELKQYIRNQQDKQILGALQSSPGGQVTRGFQQGSELAVNAANRMLVEIGRIKSGFNAGLNAYVKHGEEFYEKNPDLRSPLNDPGKIARAWTSAKTWQNVGGTLDAFVKGFGQGFKDPNGVALSGVMGYLIPASKGWKITAPADIGAFGQDTALRLMAGKNYVNLLGTLEGMEAELRAKGMNTAADELAARMSGLSTLQRNALARHQIPVSQIGDAVLDFAVDPTDIVTASGKIAYFAAVRKVPAIGRAVEATTTLAGATRALRNPRVQAVIDKLGGGTATAVTEGLASKLDGAAARKVLKTEAQVAKLAIAQSTHAIAQNVQRLRNMQREIYKAATARAKAPGKPLQNLLNAGEIKKIGGEMAAGFDDFTFHYIDAGNSRALYESREAVEKEMKRLGYLDVEVEKMRAIAGDMIKLEDDLGYQLTRTGLLSKGAYAGLKGRHIRYMYSRGLATSKEDIQGALDEMLTGNGSNNFRVPTHVGKRRNPDVDLENFTKASLAHGMGARTQATAVGRYEFTERIAGNPDFARADSKVIERKARQVPIVDEIISYDKYDNYIEADRSFGRPNKGRNTPGGNKSKVLVTTGDTINVTTPEGRFDNVTIVSVTKDKPYSAPVVTLKTKDGKTFDLDFAEVQSGNALITQTKGPARFRESDVPANGVERIDRERIADYVKAKRGDLDDLAQQGDAVRVTLPDGSRVEGRLGPISKSPDGSPISVDLELADGSHNPLEISAIEAGTVELQRSGGMMRVPANLLKEPGPGKPAQSPVKIVKEASAARITEVENEIKALRAASAKLLNEQHPGGIGMRNQQLAIIKQHIRENQGALEVLREINRRGSVDFVGMYDEATGDFNPAALSLLAQRHADVQERFRQADAAVAALGNPPKLGTRARADFDRRKVRLEASRGAAEKDLLLAEGLYREAKSLQFTQNAHANMGTIKSLKQQRKTIEARMKQLNADDPQLAELEAAKMEIDGALGEIETKRSQRIDADKIVTEENKMLAERIKEYTKDVGVEAGENAPSAPAHFVQLPQSDAYGALSGMWVHPEVKKFIDDSGDPLLNNEKTRAFAQMSKNVVTYMKYIKTVLNPATFSTNMIGNAILADTGARLNGTSIFRYPIAWTIAAEELLRGKGPFLDLLRKHSNIMNETSDLVYAVRHGGSIGDYLPKSAGQRALDYAVTGLTAPGHAYQKTEQYFKLMLFTTFVKSGKDPAEAAKLAQRYLFDYSDVPQIVQMARSYGAAPFITFPYKATQVLLETLHTKPSLINRWNTASNQAHELVPGSKEKHNEMIAENPWMAGKPLIPMNFLGGDGEPVFLDLTRQMPWGAPLNPFELLDPEQLAGNSFVFGLPTGTWIQVAANQQFFSGNPIAPEGMNPKTAMDTKVGAYLQNYMPSFGVPRAGQVPILGGIAKGLGVGDAPISPAGARIERGFTGLQNSRQKYSVEQKAWASVAQSIFGLATYQRTGKNAPGAVEGYERRVTEGSEEAEQIKGRMPDALKVASDAFNGLARGETPLTQFPSVGQINELKRLNPLIKASEDQLKLIIQNGSVPRDVKRRQLTNQISYLWALRAQKYKVQMQLGELTPTE